ncbi:hypothetical protein EP7_002622 [Isosphaeraceae bacterium EP7]
MKLLVRFADNHYTIFSIMVASASEITVVFWGEWYGGRSVMSNALQGNRSAVYGAFASIFGSLLGFVITAVSIVLGFSTSERLAIVRNSKHYPSLWASFTHTIRILGLATIVSIVSLICDRDSNSVIALTYMEIYIVFLSVLLLCRSIWALERVVEVVASPVKSSKSV